MTVVENIVEVDPGVLGARLKNARRRRRLTQEGAARQLGVARTTLLAIEKGERRLKVDELVQLSQIYATPVHDLVRTSALPGDLVPQFRLPAFESVSQPELEAALAELEALCDEYLELEQINESPLARQYPAEYPLTSAIDADAVRAARSERGRLGLGDGPIHNLRTVLEADVGLRVFMLSSLPGSVAGLYAYTDAVGGVIAVNGDHPRVRRRMSLAHEYAHFLSTRFRPEVTFEDGYQRVPAHERFARTFALEFLVPSSGLSARFEQMKTEANGRVGVSDLVQLAFHYQVSMQVLIGRLEELKLVRRGLWERLDHEGFSMREAVELLGLPAGDDRAELLPIRYKALAVEAHRRGRLSEGRLASLLRLPRIASRRLVKRLGAISVVVEDGDA